MQPIAHSGSVQRLDLPGDLKELCKTVWEVKQRTVRDMAADSGAYIDQSQSLSIHMVGAATARLSSKHFHGWQLAKPDGHLNLRRFKWPLPGGGWAGLSGDFMPPYFGGSFGATESALAYTLEKVV
jgi:hypothetical protein